MNGTDKDNLITDKPMDNTLTFNSFGQFSLPDEIIKALDEESITSPTPIQSEVIPLVKAGRDVVAKAPTGTGKTLAFALPVLADVDRESKDVQVLVLCPTRELVIQICEVFQSLVKYYERVRIAGLYGGQNIQRQLFCLRKKPQIVVGTPGRLLDHLDRRTLRLSGVRYFILDEADEMLDMGFRGDIEKVAAKLGECRKLCFSATLPPAIKQLTDSLLDNPVYAETKIDGGSTPEIEQYYTVLKDSQRVGAMLSVIGKEGYDKVIAFCNTKLRADKLGEALAGKKMQATVIHGDLKQSERTQIIKRFKAGQLNILVATDVAARGLDIDDVQAVFNFDPPTDKDFYVHRIGRTARNEKKGAAYTFVDSSQVGYIPSYQSAVGDKLKFMELPNIGDSYTLPKDSSNKMADFHDNESRYFLNVGKKDLLDKDSLTKLLLTSTALKIYEIADIKIRDTYSFVSVIKGNEKKLFKLQGITLGNRKVNIQQAIEEEKPERQSDFKRKDKTKQTAKRPYADKSDKRIGKSASDKKPRGAKSERERKNFGKGGKKSVSQKMRFAEEYATELAYSSKKHGAEKKRKR